MISFLEYYGLLGTAMWFAINATQGGFAGLLQIVRTSWLSALLAVLKTYLTTLVCWPLVALVLLFPQKATDNDVS